MGTWVVDFYASEAANTETALSNYYAADFPDLVWRWRAWADSLMWAIPAPLKAN